MSAPSNIVVDNDNRLQTSLQDRLFAILDEARVSGWTKEKSDEVERLASSWRQFDAQVEEAIAPPRYAQPYSDRAVDCEHEMDTAVRDLVDRAQLVGWKTPEVLDAIESAVEHHRLAYAEDPDPSDDPA